MTAGSVSDLFEEIRFEDDLVSFYYLKTEVKELFAEIGFHELQDLQRRFTVKMLFAG